MFDALIRWSVQNKAAIGLGLLLWIGWGVYALQNLPIDAVPDITNNQVQVMTVSPNLAAPEVEQYITYPIETSLSSLPQVAELRSLSRMGLSVVTVVFEESVDPWLARQWVGERLADARSQIPAKYGSPALAPPSTGLGEIYQYVLEVDHANKTQYSLSNLRSLQDWVVKRQLLGTAGVAEVSSFGGHLKQYEVAIDPNRLRAHNLSYADVLRALETNNENTGAAYLERGPEGLFIRGLGLLQSKADIEQVAIKINGGQALTVGQLGEVREGAATRYGALTRNGEGEVVGGIVLMLKGENSAQVTERVRKRIKAIERTLPEGVRITPYLDRSDLAGRAIRTVRNNLVEGGLIVIFVLTLLLGNARAGLIVASVIPLALLFAIGMMHATGVSGNLMSLGAIDFGLIVDGAVIVVESIVHRLAHSKGFGTTKRMDRAKFDNLIIDQAGRIRQSAAFGEIIILIVYLPLLALEGIEGKMFRPMAMTVSYAILGALILSMTYVPAASALLLNRKPSSRRTVADHIMAVLERLYRPAIRAALRLGRPIVVAAVLMFAVAGWGFMRLGGEFIPTLEEGNIAMHATVQPGSSLRQSIAATSEVESILKSQFPEVLQVVSKIGASEIPTDPMGIETADVMVILKPQSEWTSASNRLEMIAHIEKALDVPGVKISSFSQPIQMRFNELMTGIRSDVAIELYGDHLDTLAQLAKQIESIADHVSGVTDLFAEQVRGLPQLAVEYRPEAMARFGVSREEANLTLRAAMAGEPAGLIYEGEKRFDLVVRMPEELRGNLRSIEELPVRTADGGLVPLSALANVRIIEGPMQISRYQARRRLNIGFNVRGRDVESVVEELQSKLSGLPLPVGYRIDYGGEFENLAKARARLAIAVPLALALILALLYFTLKSWSLALLIFSAVPLSAIGGVAALYLRGMPFSISAGVGFIALFGVAVLNGIVLVARFEDLKREGMHNPLRRVFAGTLERLRPVAMTALVASLGFLPMALSTTSGAEVQRPLATVVIGGLLTATLLTLLLLPVVYLKIARWQDRRLRIPPAAPLVALLLICPIFASSQSSTDTIRVTRETLLHKMNELPALQARQLAIDRENASKAAARQWQPVEMSLMYGTIQRPGDLDYTFMASQRVSLPSVYSARNETQRARIEQAAAELNLSRAELAQSALADWHSWRQAQQELQLMDEQLRIWKDFQEQAESRSRLGDSNPIVSLSGRALIERLEAERRSVDGRRRGLEERLRLWMGGTDGVIIYDGADSALLAHPDLSSSASPYSELQQRRAEVEEARARQVRLEQLPELHFGWQLQSIERTGGAQAVLGGVSVPWSGSRSRIEASKLQQAIEELNADWTHRQDSARKTDCLRRLNGLDSALKAYRSSEADLTAELIAKARANYRAGEIEHVELLQYVQQAFERRRHYSMLLLEYQLIYDEYLLLSNQIINY